MALDRAKLRREHPIVHQIVPKVALKPGYKILRDSSDLLEFTKGFGRERLVSSEDVAATQKLADVLNVFAELKILKEDITHLEIAKAMERKKKSSEVYRILTNEYKWFPAISDKALYTLKPYADQAFMITNIHGKSEPFDPSKFRAKNIEAGIKAFKEARLRPTASRLGEWIIIKEVCRDNKENSYYARLAGMEFPLDLAIGIGLDGSYDYENLQELQTLPRSYIQDMIATAVL